MFKICGDEEAVLVDCYGAPHMECDQWHAGYRDFALRMYLQENESYVMDHFRTVKNAMAVARMNGKRGLTVGVFCKCGTHRSVSIGYLLREGARASGVHARLEHLSRPAWSKSALVVLVLPVVARVLLLALIESTSITSRISSTRGTISNTASTSTTRIATASTTSSTNIGRPSRISTRAVCCVLCVVCCVPCAVCCGPCAVCGVPCAVGCVPCANYQLLVSGAGRSLAAVSIDILQIQGGSAATSRATVAKRRT